MVGEELIIKDDSTINGTAMPGKEGRHNLCQQLGLKSSRRLTIGTNSPNMDHHGYITELRH